MFGHSDVPCASWKSSGGTGNRFRSAAFPAVACLAALSTWWLPVGAAHAASYPPALGCAVTASTGSGGVGVQGAGFRAGSPVRVTAGGHATRAVPDSAGSFQAWLASPALPAGTPLTATGPGCTAHTLVANLPSCTGQTPNPPCTPGSGTPAPPSDTVAAAIPVMRLAHVPSHLFLGLAGAVLLAGAALTGLIGRWGHRAEGRPSRGAPVSGTGPLVPDSL